MDEQIDMEIDGEKDTDGNLLPDTICIRFKHPEINNRLAKFAKAKKTTGKSDCFQRRISKRRGFSA